MNTLNLGILAHVDAGKTSLTERLLYAAGVIDEIGSVDDGSTQTDTLALERQRGITIKSAVVSFAVDDVTVNLIDTPGHPDFIAEVERVLSVLDGAVLVVSAVEGVQAQTRVLLRTLQRLGIPTLLFVNKIDRAGARDDRHPAAPSPASSPRRSWPWGRSAGSAPATPRSRPTAPADAAFTARLAELLADHDDALLAAAVDDQATVPYRRLRRALADQVGRGLVHPVFFGSAITGAGVADADRRHRRAAAGRRAATRTAPARGPCSRSNGARPGRRSPMSACSRAPLRVRDRVRFGEGNEGRVTAIAVFDRGAADRRASVAAGRIAKLWGLGEVQIGDAIGGSPAASAQHWFAPPTLETVVLPRRPADKGALHTALAQLAEQDPLINLRQDDTRQELFVSLYGEVQKEVIEATLAGDYGLEVDVPRDHHHLHRAAASAAARRSSTSARSRTRSWPPSGCGSTRRRPAPARPSGWRSSSGRCRSRSSRRSRRPCTRRWARGSTAGRSPTARSP